MKASYRLTVCLLAAIATISVSPFNLFAQKRPDNTSWGFKAGFATHLLKMKSNIREISDLDAMLDGGFAGIVAGNDYLRVSSELAGFYYAADNTNRTIDLIVTDVAITCFPLAWFKQGTRIQPYFSGGVALSRFKFYGHYLKTEQAGKRINYSAPEPYIGKQKTTSLSLATGIEYKLFNCEFVHLFIDAKMSHPLHHGGDVAFEHTSPGRVLSFSTGVIFGSRR